MHDGARIHQLTKEIAYWEGVVHGWNEAAREVSAGTNRVFTLNEPKPIKEAARRINKLRNELEDIRHGVPTEDA